MYSRLGTRLTDALHSFWFLPSVMVILAVLLAEGTVKLDERLGYQHITQLALYKGDTQGARAVLGGIAAAMFGVSSTVFSITIAALSTASNQMGPRLMESFTRDWHNSFALGTFLSTVAYTLITLRYIRGPSDTPGFMPHLSVTIALTLTFLSVGVLIYFIHHTATSINVGYVIRLVHDDLQRTLIHQTIPGEGRDQSLPKPTQWTEQDVVRAPHSGYLQSVNTDALTRLAEKHNATIRLLVRPGDFLASNIPIALVTPRTFPGITATLTIGRSRTTNQDVEYAARKLVEVAARALSPGLNDPYTAMAVLDHLGDTLCLLHDRALPNGQYERGGHVRLEMPLPDFQGLVETMFNMIRQYGKTHPAVMIRILEVLTQAAGTLDNPHRREVLRTHAQLTRDAALKHTEAQHDRDAIERRFERFMHTYRTPPRTAHQPASERHE